MSRETAGVIDGIEALNLLGKYKIKGYEEQDNEDRKEKKDEELKESIFQGIKLNRKRR